jgi:methionyl-tRNA formyltransferase
LSTVFLGTSEFAAAVLQRLAASEAHRPTLVLTRPDRPRGRGRRVGSPPVARRARELGLALEQPERVNDAATRELIARVARAQAGAAGATGAPAAGAAVVVVCAFGALIAEPLLSEHELLNVHPSMLPRWRGAAPIERAIMAGDELTGVSILRVTAGLDSGPVCAARREPIRRDDTYGSLASRLQALAGELLLEVLDRRAAGEPLAFIAQEESLATYAEKIDRQDRVLDPSRPALDLERRVRALSPHVGARVALSPGRWLGVLQARLAGAAERLQPPPGPFQHDGRLLLGCRPGVLELVRVQPPGGRPMDGGAFLRGHGLSGEGRHV